MRNDFDNATGGVDIQDYALCKVNTQIHTPASRKNVETKDKGSPDPFIRNKTKALIGLNLKF